MRGNCKICSERNVGPEHVDSEKHRRNVLFQQYLSNKKQFAGNRKGAIVTCNVKSITNSSDAKIKISVKPGEAVTFSFTLKNDSSKELNVEGVKIINNSLNFNMVSNGDVFKEPYCLHPRQSFPQDIRVKFGSAEVGQYEVPIVFYFKKPDTGMKIIIIREMAVFVESQAVTHEKQTSPYAENEVHADYLKPTHARNNSRSAAYKIPSKEHKQVYASDLRVFENTPQAIKSIAQKLKTIFDTKATEQNYIDFFHHLLWFEETIVRINLKKYNMSQVPLKSFGDFYRLTVPGLAEKRPSLLAGDLLFVKPHGDDTVMFEGVISKIDDNDIHIKGIDHEFAKYYKKHSTFDIRFFLSRLTLERMHSAIDNVRRENQLCRVFPKENKKVPIVKLVTRFYNPLVESNHEQRSAVEHILAGTSGTAPYMVHGPPGTGKTITIVETILQLVNKNPSNRILVCTDSNMAADHVATQLINYLPKDTKMMLRANSEFRVWETMPSCLAKYSNGTSRDTFTTVSIKEFISYNVVITTLSHSAKFAKDVGSKNMKRPITHLFIDEAAQASEPACLIPIVGLLKPNGTLVLAGDPLQLGPVVISHSASKHGLGLSLMERLMKSCPLYDDAKCDANYMQLLRNNFRSDPDILDIPNQLFYNQQLRALAAADPLSKVDILGDGADSRSVVFHGVLSKEQRMGKSPSYFNNMEAELVQKYITKLITTHKVQPEDIGVVTPYIRQTYKIKTWLQSKGYNQVEVGTVEAYQGKEKRVIIISTVRANCQLLGHDAKFKLGFLVDDKRFNVALTRAKSKVIVVGNPLCLSKDEKWRRYIDKCRDLGTHRGFDAKAYMNMDVSDGIRELVQDMNLNKETNKNTK